MTDFVPFSEFDQDGKYPHKSSGKLINDPDVSAEVIAAANSAAASAATATTQAGIATSAVAGITALSGAATDAAEAAALSAADALISKDAALASAVDADAAAVAAAASAAEAAATVLGNIPEDTIMGRDTSGTGPIQNLPFTPTMRTLAAAVTTAARHAALGISEFGSSIATAADAAAARVLLGITTFGSNLVTLADLPALRTLLGFTSIGTSITTAADAPAVVTLLGLGGVSSAPQVLLTTVDVTNTPTISFGDIFSTHSEYSYFWIVLEGIKTASLSTSIRLRFSDDAGATYESGGSYYGYTSYEYKSSVSGPTNQMLASTDSIVIEVNGPSSVVHAMARVFNAADSGQLTTVVAESINDTPGYNFVDVRRTIGSQNNPSVITGFQLSLLSGNFNAVGKVHVYGSKTPF